MELTTVAARLAQRLRRRPRGVPPVTTMDVVDDDLDAELARVAIEEAGQMAERLGSLVTRQMRVLDAFKGYIIETSQIVKSLPVRTNVEYLAHYREMARLVGLTEAWTALTGEPWSWGTNRGGAERSDVDLGEWSRLVAEHDREWLAMTVRHGDREAEVAARLGLTEQAAASKRVARTARGELAALFQKI